jgi:anti-sigma regulatory factor (Ser/Thr protein kinase)
MQILGFDLKVMGMNVPEDNLDHFTSGASVHEIELENEPSCLSTARTFVGDFLNEVGVNENDSFGILLALNEAVANALKHGRQGKRDKITLRCDRADDELRFAVEDNGPGFDFDEEMTDLPDPLEASGRGLYLMSELMDRVEVRSSGRGTTVLLCSRPDLKQHADCA